MWEHAYYLVPEPSPGLSSAFWDVVNWDGNSAFRREKNKVAWRLARKADSSVDASKFAFLYLTYLGK